MENLIEKLKTVDKKVWIGVGIGAAVLIILIIGLVIGGGNKKPSTGTNTNKPSTEAGTETEAGATEVFGTEDVTEVIGTEMATETEMSTETEMTETESQAQSDAGQSNAGQSNAGQSNGGQNNAGQSNGGTTSNVVVTQPESVGGVEQTPVTKTEDGQEILGMGSKDHPYEVIPDLDSMSLTTVEVPAGQTLYYKIQRVGGMYFNINDSDLYVIDAAGNRHDSSFVIENAMPNEYVSFQIGNKGGASKVFTIKFSNLKGSQMNPEKLSGNGPFTKHLNAGDDKGYYFQLNAAQAGTLRIYMSATANTEMNVQNNGGVGTVARSFTVDYQTDENGRNYIELPVNAGDEIRIHVQAVKPTRGSIPATDITFEVAYY